MDKTEAEIDSQPEVWADPRITYLASELPTKGQAVGIIGCGTSLYIAQTYAAFREASGHGPTDAFAASIAPRRPWDCLIALSRSGTTTEVLDAVRDSTARRTVALTASEGSPLVRAVDRALVAPFADEISVVQTRFATTALATLLISVGYSVDRATRDTAARSAELSEQLLDGCSRFVFVGTGWTYGVANEAALKLQEMAHCWAESYPALEYRHGPISVSGPNTLVWGFGPRDQALVDAVADTGSAVHWPDCDPLASLVEVQRLGLRLGANKGIDPDRPSHLSRSVILADEAASAYES